MPLRPLVLACLGTLVAAAEPVRFPSIAEVPPAVCTPPDAALGTASGGRFLVDGAPRFLVGVQLTNTLKAALGRTAGYPAELAWVYEGALDWADCQRLGFDSLGFFTRDAWLASRWPGFRSAHHQAADEAFLDGWLRSARLPVYVDFTCFPWTHGALVRGPGRGRIAPEALNAGGDDGERNHWVPYSAVHPAGLELYRAMWEAGVRQVRDQGLRPLYYELFNEPGYDDPSPAARQAFAAWLAAGMPQADERIAALGPAAADPAVAAAGNLRATPGLAVAWGRFMEERFAALVAEGVRSVRALDPGARCAVQPLGGVRWREVPLTNVDLQAVNRHLDVVSTPTGGGIPDLAGSAIDRLPARAVEAADPDLNLVEGLLMRRFLAAIAGDRPIVDGEMYAQRGAEETVAAFWLQAVRGGGAAYLFEWGRRSWDPDWAGGTEAGGRKVAAKFPWYLLNPYGVPTGVLTAPLAFKREFLRAGDAFIGRDRGLGPAPVALLLSSATARFAAASGSIEHHQIRAWAGALAFSHQDWDVLTEERLAAEGPGACRVIVAPAVRNVLPGTGDRLRAFVTGGGTLIAGGGVLGEDPYGRPLPREGLFDLEPGAGDGALQPVETALPPLAGLDGPMPARPVPGFRPGAAWRPLAATTAGPVLVERRAGAGRLVYLGARLGTYPLAALLGRVLQREGAVPPCSVRRDGDGELAVQVEVHASRRGGHRSWFLLNLAQTPQLVRLRPADGLPAMAADLVAGRRLPVDGDGVLALLPPLRAVVVALDGPGADLPLADRGMLLAEAAEQAARAAATAEERRAGGEVDDRPVPSARAVPIDLRPFANRAFRDGVAGDGVGGWTDQGAVNSLDGVPFGRQVWRGVPVDIIRFDTNANRTCIAMASPRMQGGAEAVRGIPVGAAVGTLHLVTATAWSAAGAEALRLVVRYADGGSCAVPVRCGVETGDWWLGDRVNREAGLQARIAFRNADGKGLFVWGWENPEPERTVASLDLEATGAGPIALVAAITREEPGLRLPLLDRAPAGIQPFNGARAGHRPQGVRIDAGERGWSGAGIRLAAPVALPAGSRDGLRLDLELSGADDLPLPGLQVRLRGTDVAGREVAGAWVRLASTGALSPLHRSPWLPAERLLGPGVVAVTWLDLQFPGDVPPRAGAVVRGARLAR